MSRIEKAMAIRKRINMGVLGAIQSGAATLEEASLVIDQWVANITCASGDIVAFNGLLYKCVQGHTTQSDWTPDITPALWANLGVSEDKPTAIPVWVQPTGAQDAYTKGTIVTHNGKTWTNSIDANVWEPGVYGWVETIG